MSRNSDNITISGASLVIGIVAGAITTKLVTRSVRLKKTLDGVIIVNTPILTAQAIGAPKIRVEWGDTGVLVEPRLVKLRVVNTGKVPISGGDFDPIKADDDQGPKKPIWLVVQGGAVIVSANLVAENVAALGNGEAAKILPFAERKDTRVGLKIPSLEEDEWVEVQLILDGPAADVHVEARCGLSRGHPQMLSPTVPAVEKGSFRWWLFTTMGVSAVGLIILIIVAALIPGENVSYPLVILLLVDLLVGFLAAIVASFLTWWVVIKAARVARYAKKPGRPVL